MKRAFLILLCVTCVIGCEESKIEILQRRLDNFRNVLPPELREEFDSKNYQAVVKGIDSLLQDIPAFKDKYERLKHEELIDVFSPQEVVDFFREYFVEEIERLKQAKERNW
ncbi:MAG: hypothetical protein KAW02_05520 [candidate division Zixibacteria bacterium]|nr:hypothetical protein [candidate division Zixibacteria bacterium]